MTRPFNPSNPHYSLILSEMNIFFVYKLQRPHSLSVKMHFRFFCLRSPGIDKKCSQFKPTANSFFFRGQSASPLTKTSMRTMSELRTIRQPR